MLPAILFSAILTLARASIMKTSRVWFGLGIVILCGLHSSAAATVVTSAVNSGLNGSQSFYDAQINATDLVNTGEPTLSSVTSTAATYGPYTLNGLHDGAAVLSAGVAFWYQTPTVVTFTLDTSSNTLGYDITSLININGYSSDARTYANQSFDILYSTVAAPLTFLPLATVSYLPYTDVGSGSTMVTLTDTTGVLATNVAGLRLIIPLTTLATETGVFREFDAIGIPTVPVPEPSTFALLSLGAIGLAVKSRRRAAA